MGFCLGVQTVCGWISPEIILGLENGGLCGALAVALGRRVLENLSEGSPMAGQHRRRLAPGGAVEDCFISK